MRMGNPLSQMCVMRVKMWIKAQVCYGETYKTEERYKANSNDEKMS